MVKAGEYSIGARLGSEEVSGAEPPFLQPIKLSDRSPVKKIDLKLQLWPSLTIIQLIGTIFKKVKASNGLSP